MRHRIKAGTDGATICAFDPAALPEDFDQRVGDDPMGLMEALREQGRLWLGGTGGDGTHTIEVRVAESEPSARALWRGQIAVPSGALWVCGAEYMARAPEHGSAFTPRGGLGRHAMGARIELPPGHYALSVVQPAQPETATRVTAEQWRSTLGMGLVLLGGLAAVIMGVALTIAAVLKSVQWFTDNPLASSGLHALPPMLSILLAGLVAVVVGKKLAAAGAPANSAPETPDLILALTPLDPPAPA